MSRLHRWGWACALLLASGCSEEPQPPQEVAQRVEVVVFGREATTEVLEYPGTIAAADRAEASFEVPGRIVELPVNEGDEVEAGQLLARLDPSDYRAQLEKEQALVRASRADFERQKHLFEEGVASKQEFDLARRNYEVAAANLKIAEKALADTELRAPFAGRVARKLVERFQNVKAKEPVLSFQGGSALEIKVAVPERDAARMRPGLSLDERNARVRPEVLVSAAGDRAFPARLTEFATRADPTTRTFGATFTFGVPADVTVLPGMTASARLHVPAGAGIGGASLPVAAVFSDAGGAPSVWIVDPDALRVSARAVSVGEISGGQVRVTDGIEPGEWVAVTGVHRLREGMAVRRPEL